MATYQYRCDQDGVVDVHQPMGTATQAWPCPVCGADAVRVFSVPMVSFASRARMAAIDRAEKSRDQPDVVTAPPPRPASRRTPVAPPNPALKRLPRP
jgi:putative FmdB family regulatory protein